MSKSSKRKHPAYTNAQLANLSLSDLLNGINPEALAEAATKPRSEARNINILNRESQREAEIAAAAERHRRAQHQLSPWQPEALILCLLEVTCTHCASTVRYPAAETIMVRFRHRRNGSVWEVSNHPCQLNPGLPKETQVLPRTVHVCESCFASEGTAEHYWNQQTNGA